MNPVIDVVGVHRNYHSRDVVLFDRGEVLRFAAALQDSKRVAALCCHRASGATMLPTTCLSVTHAMLIWTRIVCGFKECQVRLCGK